MVETLEGCRQEPNSLVLPLKDKLGHDFLAMAALAPDDSEAMVKTKCHKTAPGHMLR